MCMRDLKPISSQLKYFYDFLERHYQTGNIEEIESFLKEEEHQLVSTAGSSKGLLIAVYNEQGSFYRTTNRYNNSLEAFDKAKNEITRCLGKNCLEYATLINNMGGTYRLAREYKKAIQLFFEASEIYDQLNQSDTYAYVAIQNNIALAYQEMGDPEWAIQHLNRVLELTKALPDHKDERAITYSDLTVLYYKTGDNKEAMRCLELALEIFEECKDTKNEHYAAALNSLGGILFNLGEYERAIQVYKNAAECTERFSGENIEYAISYQNMYWVYRKMGEMAGAIDALMTTEKIYLKFFGPEHDRTKMVQDELVRVKQMQ